MINLSYRAIFKEYMGFEMQITEYGKPHDNTYKFVETQVNKVYDKNEIERCYMIGDNLSTDIKGANQRNLSSKIKWTSIAVKTGVFRGSDQEVESSGTRPDFVVEDFNEAI